MFSDGEELINHEVDFFWFLKKKIMCMIISTCENGPVKQ